jgi:hypothetical protein
MPITSYASYVNKIKAPRLLLHDTKNTFSTVTGRMSSLWMLAPSGPISQPTATPVVCTGATSGAFAVPNSTGIQRLAQVACSLAVGGHLIICDRLSHRGALSGAQTTAQTVNTAALTRYTDGVGVMAALEIYTSIGTTQRLAWLSSYTNQAGVASKTGPSTIFGGLNYNGAGRFIPLSLASGDTGVRSVQSIHLSGTTGTQGAFGVTLFKPLFAMPIPNVSGMQLLFDSILGMCGNMPQIINDACLFYIIVASSTSTGVWLSSMHFIEE